MRKSSDWWKCRECLFAKTIVRRLHSMHSFSLVQERKAQGWQNFRQHTLPRVLNVNNLRKAQKQGCDCPLSDVNTSQRRPGSELHQAITMTVTKLITPNPAWSVSENCYGGEWKCNGALLSRSGIVIAVNTPACCQCTHALRKPCLWLLTLTGIWPAVRYRMLASKKWELAVRISNTLNMETPLSSKQASRLLRRLSL